MRGKHALEGWFGQVRLAINARGCSNPNSMALSWELHLRIELLVFRSQTPTFDPGLVKNNCKALIPSIKRPVMEPNMHCRLVMGPGLKFLSWVGSDQFFVVQIGSGQPSMVCVWKISTKNLPIFQIFSLQVRSKSTRDKGGSASYFLWVKSKLGSGLVRSGPISTVDALNKYFCLW